MGGVACNGWRFWSKAGTEAPKREPKSEAATKKPAKGKVTKKAVAANKSACEEGRKGQAEAAGEGA